MGRGDTETRRGGRISPFTILAYVILTLWAVWALLPLFWMISTSFKEVRAAIKIPPEWIPADPTLINYERLFARAPAFRWFANSAIVAVAHTLSMLLFCSMAGYAFAKKEFPGKTAIFWTLLSTMMIPGMVLLVPLFLLVSKMGLMNNYGGLILPGLVGAFGVFLMKQFIGTLPNELLDAARIDGASEFGVYSRVILPLSKPALAVLGMLLLDAVDRAQRWEQEARLARGQRGRVALDDLDKVKSSDWMQSQLFMVLNRRLTDRLPTVITCNARPGPQLAAVIGKAATDRLMGRAVLVSFEGPSYRSGVQL